MTILIILGLIATGLYGLALWSAANKKNNSGVTVGLDILAIAIIAGLPYLLFIILLLVIGLVI